MALRAASCASRRGAFRQGKGAQTQGSKLARSRSGFTCELPATAMETDQLRLSEMAYLHVPDKERSKSPSPCDSLASSATDISTLPIHDRTPHHDEHVSETVLPALGGGHDRGQPPGKA